MVLHDILAQAAQSIAKRLKHLVRGRMVLLGVVQNLLRRLVWIDLFCGIAELLLVLAQIGVADLQQLIERNIHHFVVEKLLAVVVGAQAEIAFGSGQLNPASAMSARPAVL